MEFIELIKLNLSKPLDWKKISMNPNITIKNVIDNPNLPWNFECICRNPNITPQTVAKNPNLPWDYSELINNRNWNVFFIDNILDCLYVNYIQIIDKSIKIIKIYDDEIKSIVESIVENILRTKQLLNWDTICKYSNLPWNWFNLSCNRFISWDIIKNNIDKPWIWERVSVNPNVTMEIIDQNMDLPWDWKMLPLTGNLTWKFVKSHKLFNSDKSIIYMGIDRYVKKKKKLPLEFVDFEYLSGFDIPLDYIEQHLNEPWNWHTLLCCNKYLTFEFIKKYHSRFVDWCYVSMREFITCEIVKQNSELPWNYSGLSCNINITPDFIQENINKPWNWKFISLNTFRCYIEKRERVVERTRLFKEELIAKCWNVEMARGKWLVENILEDD